MRQKHPSKEIPGSCPLGLEDMNLIFPLCKTPGIIKVDICETHSPIYFRRYKKENSVQYLSIITAQITHSHRLFSLELGKAVPTLARALGPGQREFTKQIKTVARSTREHFSHKTGAHSPDGDLGGRDEKQNYKLWGSHPPHPASRNVSEETDFTCSVRRVLKVMP